MPPSQRSGSSSEGRLRGASARYIDIDIDSDMVANKRSHTRSDHGRPPPAAKEGNTWDGATDLHIEVGDRSFCFHKFPSISKSGKLNGKKDRVVLSDIPGGSDAFELVARFLYGQEVELTPGNVAAIRCAAEYLEMRDSLVRKAEEYLHYNVLDSWRDCITVLKSCSELTPWAEDLEIVRRCTDAIASRVSSSSRSSKASRDWWFDDVCSLSIDYFSKVIRSVTGKGQALVPAAVQCYAENWLQLIRGSDMSTTLKSEHGASYQDATHAQHKDRAVLQGIVNVLPPQLDSMPVKFLLKLLRVACVVNADTLCKTDLAKRIGVRLEHVSVDDLLILASSDSTYDVDIVLQIVEFYVQEQSYENSPPFSPRSSVSGSSMSGTTSRSSSLRSLSSVSSSDLSRSLSGSSLSGSSVTSGSSMSGRSVSGSSSDISRSSSDLSSRSSSSSFRSTTDSESTELDSETSSSSSSGLSSVKKPGFYASPGRNQRSELLPCTLANFTVAQLLETYLDEIAKDSSICLEKFITLAELFTEFPRDSDDSLYRAIDGFLRAHPSLTEMERRKLCRVMDTGALSLAASVHAASNERLPVRVIVQLLFMEQVKLRNGIAGNDVINEKDLGSQLLPSFSSTTTSTSESTSDATSRSSTTSTTTSSSTSTSSRSRTPSITKSRTPRISSANEVNLQAIAKSSPSAASVVSSQLLGGLSVKETLRFVLAEIEMLRKSVQEIETVDKSRLSLIDTLQQEMQHLSTKFSEISHDYIGMTQQVEELTKTSSKNTTAKSGWTSGWKKVTKSFQSKECQEHTPPLAPVKVTPDAPPLPTLKTSRAEATPVTTTPKAHSVPTLKTLHPKTPRAEATPVTTKTLMTWKSETLHPTTPRADSATLMAKNGRADSLPKVPRAESLPMPKTANIAEMCPRTPRADIKPVIVKKDLIIETMTPRGSFKLTQETPKSETPSSRNITGQRSHHVEDAHRRSVRSRSTSPNYTDITSQRSHHVEDVHRRQSTSPPRHSVSVTSTSSYSSYSSYSTTSSRSGHRAHGSHSRGHHKPKENHGPAHRRHRQKEGTHDSVDRHSGASSYHHRHKEGSTASHHTHDDHRYSRQSHSKHHDSKERFSASEGSIGTGRRRRHRS